MSVVKTKIVAAGQTVADAVGVHKKHLPPHSAYPPKLHTAVNEHNKELDELKAIHRELSHSTNCLKDFAVASSKFSGAVPSSHTGLQQGSIEMTKLSNISDHWGVLSQDMDYLLKGEFADCHRKNHTVKKLAKRVEKLKKKNDSSAPAEEHRLKVEMEALEANIAHASMRYQTLLERLSKEYLKASTTQFRETADALEKIKPDQTKDAKPPGEGSSESTWTRSKISENHKDDDDCSSSSSCSSSASNSPRNSTEIKSDKSSSSKSGDHHHHHHHSSDKSGSDSKTSDKSGSDSKTSDKSGSSDSKTSDKSGSSDSKADPIIVVVPVEVSASVPAKSGPSVTL